MNTYYRPNNNFIIYYTPKPQKRRLRIFFLIALFTFGAISIGWKFYSSKKQAAFSSSLVPTQPQNQMLTATPSEPKQPTLQTSSNPLPLTATNPPALKKNDNADNGWQTVTVRSHDTLGHIFSRLNINRKDLPGVVKAAKSYSVLTHLKPGNQIKLLVGTDQHLQQLICPINQIDTLTISRKGTKYQAHTESKPLESQQRMVNLTAGNSIYQSGKKAGLSDKAIQQLMSIFKTSIENAQGIHSDDKFNIICQDYYLDGKKFREGEIVAAELRSHDGNTYQLIQFTDPKGNTAFYTPDGKSLEKKRFLSSPLKFTRISSYFSLRRWHPILHRFRHHEGVDYAAPYGTPIKSVGAGKVALIGRKGGYGNTIIIDHGSSYRTLYGHMSRYSKDLKLGSFVKQGQIIGYVGSTGLATGPHLHFEFLINGVHRNPLTTVALAKGASLRNAYRTKFKVLAKKLLAKLDIRPHNLPESPHKST